MIGAAGRWRVRGFWLVTQAHYDGPGVCPLEADSGALNRSRHPLGGRFPSGEEFPAIPPPERLADLASPRDMSACDLQEAMIYMRKLHAGLDISRVEFVALIEMLSGSPLD
jgi:hypothetical protein